MRKLNLGCGDAVYADAVNHDRVKHRAEISVVHDLNVRPWPWSDNSFDLVIAHAVLEHLDIDLVQSLDECWRILAPGGQIALKLPYWQSEIGYRDPTHRWRYTLQSLDLFDPETGYGQQYRFYTARKWKIVDGAKLNKAQSSIHITLEVRK